MRDLRNSVLPEISTINAESSGASHRGSRARLVSIEGAGDWQSLPLRPIETTTVFDLFYELRVRLESHSSPIN
jgi:hypothetical protein